MRRAGGFTLLEVLVTLVLIGLLAGSLQQGMQVILHGHRTQNRTLSAAQGVATAEQVLRGLIAQARAGTFTGQPPDFNGTIESLRFTTELPDPGPGGGSRGADVALHVDALHRLMLGWRPHSPGGTGSVGMPVDMVLLEDVAKLELGYWQPSGNVTGGDWVSPWPDRWPPRLLRLRISFPAGSRRTAVEIVAALQRDRWQP